MTSLLALTLITTAAAIAQPSRPPLAVQMTRIIARSAPAEGAAAVTAPKTLRRGDSLWNGALTGAAVGGVAMAAYGSRTCEDATCIAPVAFWAAISAGVGAAVGIGIDALFDR